MNKMMGPLHIIGISTITSNDVAHKELTALWETFSKASIQNKLKNISSSSVFCVYSNYENGDKGKYKTTIGFAVEDINAIPEGLSSITIPVGNYKIFPCKSPAPEDIVDVWKNIWSTDPQLLARNFVADFEEYKENNEAIIGIGYK